MTREFFETAEQWLGKIPSTWRLMSPKALFSERRQPCHSNDVHLTPSQTYGVLPQSKYMELTGNSVVLNLQGQGNMKHVEPDDFIIHLRSFQGGLERSSVRGKVSTAYTVLAPKNGVVADYYRWLLKSDGYIQELRTTTNQLRDGQSIKYRDFVKVPLPFPPKDEQQAIADHLDRETAQIDTLITEQQSLVAMLRERRISTIAEAVSGAGISSRDEDIIRWHQSEAREFFETAEQWLGKIPSTWRLMSPKALFSERRQPCHSNDVHLTPSQTYGVLPQSKYMELTGNSVVLNLQGQGNMKHVEPDDFIIHLRSFQGGLERSSVKGKVSTAYTVLAPKNGVVADYYRWLLKSDGYIQELRTTTNQLRDGQSIKYRDFVKVPLPFPPKDEQQAIADHLDRETAQIDTLIAESEKLIELSQERRSALITAAVTGQIDVRQEA